MPQQYDVTTKLLFERNPRDWLMLLGFPTSSPVGTVDPNLPMSSVIADKVARVEDPQPWLFHLELQARYDRDLPVRMLRYNALLSIRDELPVESVLLLLRPEADGPLLSGQFEWRRPGRPPSLTFRYTVVRLWELPVEAVLNGGLSTLPLAPLTDVSPPELPSVVRTLVDRIEREAPPATVDELWVATYTLLGLRYPRSLADQLLRGVREMRESVTYQAILEEGREEGREEGEARGRAREARRLILLFGEQKLGPTDARVRAELEAIDDPERLEALARRLLDATSWDEVLGPE